MPFKGWQNLLEVPITSAYSPLILPSSTYIFFIVMPGTRQCVNTTRHAIEFNREASPLIFNENQYLVSRLIIG